MRIRLQLVIFTVSLVSFCAISVPLLYLSGIEGDRRAPAVLQHSAPQLHGSHRSLLQLGRPWVDNEGSWPAGFSNLDRATETQRIFRAVVSERERTAAAAQNTSTAWIAWLQQYNITYNSTEEADYRRQVFDYNVALAQQLNQLAGPEVAFGINRFSDLTSVEFLAGYTGDSQDDSSITVDEQNPVAVYTPASAVIAAMQAAADAAAEAARTNGTANGTASSPGPGSTGGTDGTAPVPPGDPQGNVPYDDGYTELNEASDTGVNSPAWLGGSSGGGASARLAQLPGALYSINGGGMHGSGGRRRALQEGETDEQQQQQRRQAHEEMQQQQQQQRTRFWQRVLKALALTSEQPEPEPPQPQDWYLSYTVPSQEYTRDKSISSSSNSGSARRLQQVIVPAAPFQNDSSFCSKQVPFPYTNLLPFKTVDWLRMGAVRTPKAQSNCSNSFAYVAAALAESTMLMQGYNGTAPDISEAQLMQCFPGGSCTRGGTVHVLLNYLACNGVAAAGAAAGGDGYGTYPAGSYTGSCAIGQYHPVVTGITGWAWVPNNEFALGQALSRTPTKVSVDASILQTYRAGFIGCNVVSRVANHAMLAVGYNQQVRAGPPVPGSAQNFTFFNGSAYWMLKNSWGTLGSVDGFVYVKKGCQKAAPIGMLVNRGVIPTWNQSESFKVGRLQCKNETNSNQDCTDDELLKLAGFCAGVDDFMPLPLNSSCSCSCIPT